MVELESLRAPVPPFLATMTFPAYRHLLALDPASRHPDQGDLRLVQPLGVLAMRDGNPAGLVLGEVPIGDQGAPEMLSLYTEQEARNQGVGTALVEAFERAVRERGFRRVTAVYMTGKETVGALERVLQKRGWSPPETRTLTLRFTPDEAAGTPWFGRLSLPSPEYEIFSWKELRPEERVELERSQAERSWIASGLEPWRHDAHGFDAASSVGLRYRGSVVGWVINHRIAPDAVRFTCSFMRRDLGRRGRILPLYSESIRRLREDGCRMCTFVTPTEYRSMIEFIKRRCAPWAGLSAETRGSSKLLTAEDGE
jgi:GNAT superfamily N-acetyltransferase